MNNNIISTLQQLVSIPSHYPNEEKMGEYVFHLLRDCKFSVRKQYIDSKRFNVIAEKGIGINSILLYAHLDTVGKTEGWNSDPLKLTVLGNRAFGLGAWDMKGGLLANIIAFQKSNPKHMKLKIAFCVDEEYISKGGYSLIKSSFIQDVVCVISTEPAFQHGLQGIVTGRIGRAVYDVEISGKSHHFAFYDPKNDMNFALSDFINALKKLYKKRGDRKQFVFARSIISQTVGMSLPEKIHVELDSSILPPHTHKSMLSTLKKIARLVENKYKSHLSFQVGKHQRETPFLESYQIEDTNPYLVALKKSVKNITKKSAIRYFRSSVADENIFGAKGITTLGIGPIGGNAHSANEWVDVQSISDLSKILIDFISQVDNT